MDTMLHNQKFAMTSRLITHLDPQYNDQIQLLYCLDGQMTIEIDGEHYELGAGSVVVVNQGRYFKATAVKPAVLYLFSLDADLFKETIQTDMYFIWIDPHAERDPNVVMLKSLLNELIFYDLQIDGNNDFFKFSIFFKIMDFLVKHYLIKVDEQSGYSSSDIRAQQIRTYIQENYMKRLTLAELSQKLFISEGYLSRFFKRELKRGFIAYLNDVRLYHVTKDLLNTDDSITDISMNNGFNSISGFNQLFKKTYGESPKAYRKAHKAQKISTTDVKAIKNKTILFLKQHQDDLPKIDKTSHDIRIDARKSTNYQKNWRDIINIGNAASLLEQRLQKAAITLHEDLGYTFLRMWNIFEPVDIDGDNVNFDKLDTIFDFVIQHQMKPFLVIGPKPHVLTVDTDQRLVDTQTQEADFTIEQEGRWAIILEKWLEHVRFRYGAKELAQWYVELWKPNRWDNVYSPDYLDRWYLDWVKTTTQTITKMIPELRLGGCEFIIQNNVESEVEIQKVLQTWQAIDFTPAFISIADYPYEQTELSTRLNQLEYELTAARDTFDRVYPGIDIYVSEWNLTVSNRNVFNDTTFKGAYIIQNLTNDLEMAQQTAYWMGSDLYSEYSDSADVVYGAAGLLTKKGARKPAFFALSFLNKLLPYKLYSDVNCFVSTDDEGAFTILLACAKPFNSLYFNTNGKMTYDNYNKAFLDLEPVVIDLQIDHVTSGKYEIRTTTVDDMHGSILDLWKQLGYNRHLRLEDEQYLDSLSVPQLTIAEQEVQNDVLTLHKRIAANTFALLTLIPIH